MSTPFASYKQFKDLLDSDKLFVVAFFADWCGPSHAIRPLFDMLASTFNENMEFYSVDVVVNADITKEVGITSMPTFVLFKDGKQIDQVRGALPPALEALIMKSR